MKRFDLSYLVLLIYVILISLVIYKHEPWADEAQAWLLARDSNLFDLLFKRLRYEGHPGLWYLILFPFSKLLPYRSISLLSGLIAVLGVYVFLRYAPFPRFIRFTLPFTYFIFYQYAVIARSYVLLPALFFLTAIAYRDKREKIYRYTLLLALLAYTSVYTMLVAVVLMLLHTVDLVRERSKLDRELVVRHVKAYAAFVAFIGLILVQLWQPEDSSFARGYHLEIGRFIRLSRAVLNESTTEIGYLSILVLLISSLWFWLRGALPAYLASTTAVLALFSVKYYNSWHQGIIFLIWVFAMWISFEREWEEGKGLKGAIRRVTLISMIVVIGIQIFWSASVSISDFKGPYSAGKAAAEYIKSNHLEGRKIYATSFWTTSILPYFKENIFANHNGGRKPAFWFWAEDNRRIEDLNRILHDRPDLIIIGRPPKDLRELKGYKFIGLFPGELYWKRGIKERNDFAIFINFIEIIKE
ncbi:TPA: hypothetical protein EYP37_07425 [Candidatus Poribacteria bacterium]|nr:hypothetical protein [Candidatus Poribacteria bacterium]